MNFAVCWVEREGQDLPRFLGQKLAAFLQGLAQASHTNLKPARARASAGPNRDRFQNLIRRELAQAEICD